MMDNMDADKDEANEVRHYPILPEIDEYLAILEWNYSMRRIMQEVIPGLYLGPYASACRSKLDDMIRAGITHVVCVRAVVEAHLIRPNHPDHFQYLVVDMDDSQMEMVIPKVKTVTAFIDNALNSNGKVLVHGNAGMSRSPTLVVGYIMSKFGVTFKKASKYVQSKRFCAYIRESFAYQLMREYEPIYMAMHSTSASIVPEMIIPQYKTLKRKINEIVPEGEEEEENLASGYMRPRMDRIDNSTDLD